MFRRVAFWLTTILILAPATIRASGDGDGGSPIKFGGGGTGIYFPPESPSRPDLDAAPNERLNRNVRILRTTNRAQLNRYVPVAYEFKNVNPYAVLRFINRLVESEDGALFSFVNPEMNGGRILAMIPEYQIASLDRLVKLIDRKDLLSEDGSDRRYFQLKHRRANINLIDPVLDDSAFIATFGVYLTGNGSRIVIDPEQNAIFIKDAPSGTEYLMAAIEGSLDKPTPQALMRVSIYEVGTGNNTRLGTDYAAWKNGPGKPLFVLGAFGERARVDIDQGSASLISDDGNLIGRLLPGSSANQSGRNGAFRLNHHAAWFDYLTVRGQAKLITQVKLAALNTRTATIDATDQVLYYAIRTADSDGNSTLTSGIRDTDVTGPDNGIDGTGPFTFSNSPSFIGNPIFNANRGRNLVPTRNELDSDGGLVAVEVGISIDLTPLIYENGVDVDVEGTLSDYTGFDDTGAPLIDSRSFKTHVRIGERQEVVLGGLARTETSKGRQGPPFISKLPLLGYILAQDQTRKQVNHLFVTLAIDQIVRFDGDSTGATDGESSIMNQAEGSEPVDVPETTRGFDMMKIGG